MECDELMEKFKNCVVSSQLERSKLLHPQDFEILLESTIKNDPNGKRCIRHNENSASSDKKRCLPVSHEVETRIHAHKQKNQNDVINGFDTIFTTPKKNPLVNKERARRKLF